MLARFERLVRTCPAAVRQSSPFLVRSFLRLSFRVTDASAGSLFGETLSVFDATGANKLRGILEVKPAIREAVRRIDLSTAMRDSSVGIFFRRVAALLRRAPRVQWLQMLHVGLSDKVCSPKFPSPSRLSAPSPARDKGFARL